MDGCFIQYYPMIWEWNEKHVEPYDFLSSTTVMYDLYLGMVQDCQVEIWMETPGNTTMIIRPVIFFHECIARTRSSIDGSSQSTNAIAALGVVYVITYVQLKIGLSENRLSTKLNLPWIGGIAPNHVHTFLMLNSGWNDGSKAPIRNLDIWEKHDGDKLQIFQSCSRMVWYVNLI